MERLTLIETKCPIGHISLYRKIINKYSESYKVRLITFDDYYEALNVDYENFSLGKKSEKYNGPLLYRLSQARLIKKSLEKSIGKIVFLSYDTVAFFLNRTSISKYEHEILVLEHNNIDQLKGSIIKRMCYRGINSKVVHMCFESYISKHIKNFYGKTTVVFPHPITRATSFDNKESLASVFAPSSDSDFHFLSEIAEVCVNNKIYFYSKANDLFNNSEYVRTEKYFSNYHEIFSHSLIILISVDYEYRVSGVFYEALSYGKKVLFKDCLFAREMKKIYPDTVYISSDQCLDKVFKSILEQ